jgi:hypothetical protein
MFLFNESISPKKNSTGILYEEYISVQTTVDLTDYNIQYLRGLLHAGKLKAQKISQFCLIRFGFSGSLSNTPHGDR